MGIWEFDLSMLMFILEKPWQSQRVYLTNIIARLGHGKVTTVQSFLFGVITHPSPDLNGSLFDPLLVLGVM